MLTIQDSPILLFEPTPHPHSVDVIERPVRDEDIPLLASIFLQATHLPHVVLRGRALQSGVTVRIGADEVEAIDFYLEAVEDAFSIHSAQAGSPLSSLQLFTNYLYIFELRERVRAHYAPHLPILRSQLITSFHQAWGNAQGELF